MKKERRYGTVTEKFWNLCRSEENRIFKYEKHPTKVMMTLRYAIRYFFNNNDEITALARKVKAENDEYLTKIIESPIPPIIKKNINNS